MNEKLQKGSFTIKAGSYLTLNLVEGKNSLFFDEIEKIFVANNQGVVLGSVNLKDYDSRYGAFMALFSKIRGHLRGELLQHQVNEWLFAFYEGTRIKL